MAGLDDKELTAALKMAKKKPRNFVFSAGSKLEQHFLELSKKKIPKGVVKDAKAQTKSPKAFQGVCEYRDGVLVFQTKLSFGDQHSKALRQLVKKRAGLSSLTAELKQVDKIEERDFEAEESAEEASAQGPGSRVSGASASASSSVHDRDEENQTRSAQSSASASDTASDTASGSASGTRETDAASQQEEAGAMSDKEREDALKDIRKIQKEMEQIMKTLRAKA